MQHLTTFAACLVLSATSILLAQTEVAEPAASKPAKTVDPSGTWRWEHDSPATGEKVKDVLKLDLGKKGKVTGTYYGESESRPVEGTIKGNQLDVTFEFEFQGVAVEVTLSGQITKDKIEGEAAFDAGGESGSFPWTAERSVHASDLVGKWSFEIDSPNGKLTPSMVVAQVKGKDTLTATWKTTQGQDMDVQKIEVKKNKARFRIHGSFDGNSLTVDFAGRPYGNSMKGELEYDYNGQVGQGEFKAKREQAKKEKK